ncbi:MAG: hypothetical protein ABSF45_14720 [Terriglobia bacterium]|jgi:hypothetical protein
MTDGRELIKARLGRLGLETCREEAIVHELRDHVEDYAAALEARGMSSDAAAREALDSVSDWPEFREEILRAETEEVTMDYRLNYRSKALWLPAMCALTLSNVFLALMEVFGPLPHFYWLSRDMSMRPYFTFFVPWLISQPVVGAVAAYWSRRVGGAVLHQLLAALAPAIALLGLFVLIIPFSIILDKHVAHNIRLTAFLVLTATWVLLPSVPLLIGAAPFLRKPQPQS